jgi:hypothetical protein
MHRFCWKGADVLALIEEARTAPLRRRSYSSRIEAAGLDNVHPSTPEEWAEYDRRLEDAAPAAAADVPPQLIFVQEHGVYLMSNAELGGIQNGALVFYANGYNPDVDGFNAATIEGDFAEYLDASDFEQVQHDDIFEIRFDPRHDSFDIVVLSHTHR